MGRVYFPTGNTIGVRTLSGMRGADYVGFRAPAEPAPVPAMNPVTLGAAFLADTDLAPIRIVPTRGSPIFAVFPNPNAPPAPASPTGSTLTIPPAAPTTSTPTPVVAIPPIPPTGIIQVSTGGGTVTPALPAPIVTPTTYTTDAAGDIYNVQTGQLFLTAAQAAAAGVSVASLDAGGAAAANAAVSAAAAAPAATTSLSVTDQVAAWLSGTTALLGYNVPNALLAGGVVIVFAFLMGGKKK